MKINLSRWRAIKCDPISLMYWAAICTNSVAAFACSMGAMLDMTGPYATIATTPGPFKIYQALILPLPQLRDGVGQDARDACQDMPVLHKSAFACGDAANSGARLDGSETVEVRLLLTANFAATLGRRSGWLVVTGPGQAVGGAMGMAFRRRPGLRSTLSP